MLTDAERLTDSPVGETPLALENRCRQAKRAGLKFIEAPKELLLSLVSEEDFGSSNYVLLQGMRVAVTGTGADTLKKEGIDRHRWMHNSKTSFEGR